MLWLESWVENSEQPAVRCLVFEGVVSLGGDEPNVPSGCQEGSILVQPSLVDQASLRPQASSVKVELQEPYFDGYLGRMEWMRDEVDYAADVQRD